MRTLDADVQRRGAQAMRLAQSLAVIVGAFLAASAVTAPLTEVLVAVELVTYGSAAWEVARTVFQFLGFLLAIAGFLQITGDWTLIDVGPLDRRQGLLTVGGVVALLGLQFGVLYVFSQFGVSTGENRAMLPGRENPTYFLYMIVVSILVVGPVEELLFRGIVQGALRKAWSMWPAIILASALFGVIHVVAVAGTTEQRILYATVAMLLGTLLGYLYERTGNIAVPGMAHGFYNGSLFAIQFLHYAGYVG